MIVRVLLLVLATFTILLYGCDQASSPAERQEGGGGTPVGDAFAEAELRPVGDSGVSGNVVFKEAGSRTVVVELEVSGLPTPENPEEPKPYFAQVHEGSCSEAPRGGDQEHGEDHGDDHHGHDHEHGGGTPSLALIRLDQFLSATPKYADHPAYASPPADELPGGVDTPLSLVASADGTAAVTSLLDGVEPEQLSSGSPKYVDLRAPSRDLAPEHWPAVACADLS